MPPDPLVSRIAPSQRKRNLQQLELNTLSSSSRALSPVPASEIERWTPTTQQGTRRVPPVTCQTDTLQYIATEIPVDGGILTLGRDRVMMDRNKTRLWSIEQAKYMQWKQRTGLDDAALAQLGSAEQQRLVQAAARGARLPGW
eukprot:2668665-Rhodomonas_salina.1